MPPLSYALSALLVGIDGEFGVVVSSDVELEYSSDGRDFVPGAPVYGFTFPTVLQLLEKLPSGAERMWGWT